MKNKIILCFVSLILLMSFSLVSASYSVSQINNSGNVEYRLYSGSQHFLTIISGDGTFNIRPHPGVDVNGWGSSWYMQPFFPGATLRNSVVQSIIVNNNNIYVSAYGNVSKSTSEKYGSWNFNMSFSYNAANKEINGNGFYSINLLGNLSDSTGDLNLYKIASNYLDDVPLLNDGIGDTGDMDNATVASSNPVLNFVWHPEIQPAHFPGDKADNLSIDVSGNYNHVNTSAQGYEPIVAAYKPSLKVELKSKQTGIFMIFGGYYDTSKSQDFWEDNIGITPLILKSSSLTVHNFDVNFYSKALAGDSNQNDVDNDGYNSSIDCNDSNPNIWLNQSAYVDSDSDLYGASGLISLCTNGTLPVGYVAGNSDCNDNNPLVNPGATELCNGFDDNCNNVIDEGCSQGCVVPSDNMNITTNTVFCKNSYFTHSIFIDNDNLVVDCNNSDFNGGWSGDLFYFVGRSNITVKNCQINRYRYGINFVELSDSVISNVSCWENNYCIYFRDANRNKVYNSDLSDSWDVGVYMYNSSNNLFSENEMSNNKYHQAMYIYDSDSNIIRNNSIVGNGYVTQYSGDDGITIYYSENNTIYDNLIQENGGLSHYGIGIYSGTSYNSSNNKVYHNNFINNTHQAYDNSLGLNVWDYNYWSNYDTQAEGCYDTNYNGFCDTAYNLTLSVRDNYPYRSQDGWMFKLGDMNGDSKVNNQDIAPFVQALTGFNAYMAAYPDIGYYIQRGDLNGDGNFNNADINPFVSMLSSGKSRKILLN